MKANGGTPAMDVLDLLGNQLVMDPETLAMLKQEGKVSESEFAALLENIGQNEAGQETLFGNTEKLGNEGKSKLQLLDSALTAPTSKSTPTLTNQNINTPTLANTSTPTNNKTPQLPTALNEILAKQQVQQAPQISQAEVPMVDPKQVPNEAKAELKNPNLVKLSQFMEQQTVASQKRFQNSGQYEAAPKSIFIEKVEATNNLAKTGATNTAKAVTLQDLMFAGSDETNLDSGDKQQTQQLITPVKANTNINSGDAAKVFDLNQVMGEKALSSEALISKIQDHILQTRAGNEKNVEMSFTHKDLGQIGLQVQKHAGDSIGITISTASLEGAKFFNQNQGELLQSLNSAGIQVGDFKLDTSKSSTNQDGESSKQFAGNNKQENQSESGQRKQEQDKRKTLWEQFQDQAAA